MTRNDDFIDDLEGYLDEYEGSTPLPHEVRSAIRAQLPSIQQRPAWWPARRFPEMNNSAKLALAAAAVVVAAFLGIRFLQPGDVGVGAPGLDEAAPTPTVTVAPSPPAAPLDTHPAGEPLEPGSYFTTVAGNRITFTVPAGWQRNAVPQVLWTGNSETRLGFGDVENIYADPCQPDLGLLDPPPGPTADDLASALAAIPGVTATTADEVISGFNARYVELDAPGAFRNCVPDGGEALLSGDGPLEPALHRFWVVDVDGGRIVIHSVARAGALSRQVDEIDAIVGSIQIDTP